MTEEEIKKLIENDRKAKAICDLEFDQSVIDRCEPYFQALRQALINGTTTAEKEEALLLEQWEKLNRLSKD